MEEITTFELKEKLKNFPPDARLLDVRTLAEVAEGKIADALHIDVQDSEFIAKAQDLNPELDYYVYCKAGVRSQRACLYLEEMGLRVINVLGGYEAFSTH